MRIHATRITGSLSVSGSGGVDFTNATAGVSGSFRPSDVKVALPSNTVTSSAQIATDISGSFTAVSSSLASRLTTEESEAEGSVVSSSAQIADEISGSFTATSSSLASRIITNKSNMTLATASIAAITASVSTINSNMTLATASIAAITSSVSTINSNMTLATASIAAITASVSTLKSNVGQELNTDSDVTFADITSTGTITATEVHTTFVSASITKTSGSNIFGDDASDTHQFTGSLAISGSAELVSGSLETQTFGSNAGTLISGSLGDNASLIRSLTATNISGSFAAASSSLETNKASKGFTIAMSVAL